MTAAKRRLNPETYTEILTEAKCIVEDGKEGWAEENPPSTCCPWLSTDNLLITRRITVNAKESFPHFTVFRPFQA